jgi:Asp-tRNA(Asn)/Glu-tRNA(Gln) amidotransferase A subunit family amidase
MSVDLHQSATALADAVRRGDLSPVELVEASLDRIDVLNDRTNAFVNVLHEAARERARAAEEAVAAGDDLGPLHGVPVAIKDLSYTKAGVPYTAGIAALEENVAAETSVAVQRLEDAGAIVVGTTNTPELGHTPRTYNELQGPTGTPFDPERNAGGSSGGSAAALGEDLVPLATGSDVGGSLRTPASCCGVTAVKPTHGLIPREARPNAFGTHTPFGVLGPMARTVEDLGLLLEVMAGRNDADPFSVPKPDTYDDVSPADPDGLRLAHSPTLETFAVEAAVRDTVADALGAVEDAGATVEPAELDGPNRGDLTYSYGIAATVHFAVVAGTLEREHNLDFVGAAAADVSETFVQTLTMGRGYDATEYRETDEVRTTLYDAIESALSGYDALACPTLATPTLSHDEPFPTEIDGENVSGLPTDWMLSWVFNMTGHPVVNVPAGLVDGLPVGMQLVGPRYAESRLLDVAALFERENPWAEDYPRLEA